MPAGDEGKRLVDVVRELRRGLGEQPTRSSEPTRAPGADGSSRLGPELGDEGLVVALREELTRLAAIAAAEGPELAEERAVQTALDGAELVMRSEIAAGREGTLGNHLPGFAFIATLPGLGRARALELSRKAEHLLAEEQ